MDASQELTATLAEMPHQGNVPKELSLFASAECRELHCQCHRLVDTVDAATVTIGAIADGPHDMPSFLLR
ncbi:hypothetical protein [Ancylobacter aquaticus]|uniref:hypothetical protein n=1 Tax=Ancylobacter aquaticus TaxID=100 RepID=UPI00104A90FC|nr:hypothetical protein [Ancylobacter aquaticus]